MRAVRRADRAFEKWEDMAVVEGQILDRVSTRIGSRTYNRPLSRLADNGDCSNVIIFRFRREPTSGRGFALVPFQLA